MKSVVRCPLSVVHSFRFLTNGLRTTDHGQITTMKILVANLGSTSFKYRLFDMTDERVLARGGVERIGSEEARLYVEAGSVRDETSMAAPDHAVAVHLCLRQ